MKHISEKQCQDIVNKIILEEFGPNQCGEDKFFKKIEKMLDSHETCLKVVYEMLDILRDYNKDIKYLEHKVQELEKQIFELKNK